MSHIELYLRSFTYSFSCEYIYELMTFIANNIDLVQSKLGGS